MTLISTFGSELWEYGAGKLFGTFYIVVDIILFIIFNRNTRLIMAIYSNITSGYFSPYL